MAQPSDCGLIDIGNSIVNDAKALMNNRAGSFWFPPKTETHCTVPACWRETPGTTWQFAAAMLRNQRKQFENKPPTAAKQLQLELAASSAS